jgi:hypothetical protein
MPGLDTLLQHKKAQKITARNQGCSMQCSSKLGYSKYKDNGPEKKTEGWETRFANSEVTTQPIWTTAKALTQRGEPKKPSAIHSPLGPIFHPIDEANIIKTA